ARKALLERHAVDDDVAVARLEQYARDAALATPDRGVAGRLATTTTTRLRGRAVSHADLPSAGGVRCCFSDARNCAPCGCSAPAQTFSLRSILRPSAWCGSMPRTERVMTRSGWRPRT